MVLHSNLQGKGYHVLKELEQLKRSSAKCDAANKLPQNTISGVKYCNFLRKKKKTSSKTNHEPAAFSDKVTAKILVLQIKQQFNTLFLW